MITVGVDARTYSFRSGLGTYCRNVLSSLLAQGENCRFVVWFSKEASGTLPLPGSCSNLESRVSEAPIGDASVEQSFFRAEINSSSVDVFFSPYSPVPAQLQVPTLLTVHDLGILKYPELHPPTVVQYLRETLPPSLRSVTSIIADSTQTATDIEEFFVEAGQKTWVVPLGVESRFFGAEQTAAGAHVFERLELQPGSYILYVGGIARRKNLVRAVQAYKASALFGRIPFILAGPHEWPYKELVEEIEREDGGPWVRIVGYVDDKDLPELYRNALFFVYPSLYEGFGLTVLEAMASGVAVLTSNTSSIPDVVGDAALLVDPLEVSHLTRAMEGLDKDPELRASLGARGRSRARHFTWERTGARILRLIELAAAKDKSAWDQEPQVVNDLLRFNQWGKP